MVKLKKQKVASFVKFYARMGPFLRDIELVKPFSKIEDGKKA